MNHLPTYFFDRVGRKFATCTHFSVAAPLLGALALSGCASVFNTGGSSEYGCPGMPSSVLCKTPAAIYKSTHLDPAPTEFDTPIGPGGAPLKATTAAAKSGAAASAPGVFQPNPEILSGGAKAGGPRPIREPAHVLRIWIAPWVDKDDNLHLAQIQFTEIKPRTWTVGVPEVAAGSGYVIPRRAFDAVSPAGGKGLSPGGAGRPTPDAEAGLPGAAGRMVRDTVDAVAN